MRTLESTVMSVMAVILLLIIITVILKTCTVIKKQCDSYGFEQKHTYMSNAEILRVTEVIYGYFSSQEE